MRSGIRVSIGSRNIQGYGLVLSHAASCQMHLHSPGQMDHHQQWDKAGKRFSSRLRDEKVLMALRLYNHLKHK